MWPSLWRSFDRFSVQHLKHVISELREIKVVDAFNREVVVDLLHSIVEIVTYGDRQNPYIFECFMEFQVLAEFVRVLQNSKNSRIEAPLLQYLSIMIQNMDTEHAIYYCLSNDYVNNIISHPYKFNEGDLASYYISFLRAVSGKLNRDTLCLLLKVDGDTVVGFPLYTEALKFAQHGEQMIQTAVRALTLNIYNVCDDMVFQFVTTSPASNYFFDLVHRLRDQCVYLDELLNPPDDSCLNQRSELLAKIDKVVDDLYYLKDIIGVGEPKLTKVIIDNLLNLLIFPTLLPLLQLGKVDGLHLSKIMSLYIVSRLLQLVGGKEIFSSVVGLLVYPCVARTMRHDGEGDMENSFFNHLNGPGEVLHSGSESEVAESIKTGHLLRHLQERISSGYYGETVTLDDNICLERSGIWTFFFSENHDLVLASLFLLLTIAESEELEYSKASVVGPTSMQQLMNNDMLSSWLMDGYILLKFMPQVFCALMKVLASEQSHPLLIKCHAGWLLHKLLSLQGNRLDNHNLDLFYFPLTDLVRAVQEMLSERS